MVHVDGNRVRAKLVVKSIELVLEDSLRDNATEPAQEMLEDGAFTACQLDRRGAHTYITPDRVEVNIASLEDRAQRPARTAEQCFGAGDELTDGKGLDKVVVGAAIQPAHPVLDGIARGQDQDGNGIASFAHLAEEMDSVAVGEPEIKDCSVVGA